LILLIWIAPHCDAVAADDLFRDHVAAIFETHCLGCHNSEEKQGNFSLQTAAEFRASEVVEAGHADESRLLEVIGGAKGEPASMPKDGTPLSSKDVDFIRQWIQDGATWPDGVALKEPVVDDFDWWSLRRLSMPVVPEPANQKEAAWVRNPIDAFVVQKLRSVGLSPSAEADKRTLIRRVTYDLIGLPPSPAEVAAFVGNRSPDAYDKLVDRLLASKYYGERWARHWLDVVRYADTCGYDKDKLRPNAWPYRDYVVKSFNDDKRYDRFVKEQLAGDVLYPGTPDGILGLGFIAAGPWDFIGHVEVPESKIDGMEARNLDRDEMASSTLNVFCSATVQCARCHNHKFDPITQEHYYSLQSVFAAVDRADRPFDLDPAVEKLRTGLAADLADLKTQQSKLRKEITAAGGPELAQLRKLIQELEKRSGVKPKRPEFGYHSAIAAAADSTKWVEVDLGQDVEFSSIVLNPCHDDFGGIGAGFGFPVRFSVSAWTEASDAPVVIADRSRADFSNPGLEPVVLSMKTPVTARYIRVTATRLAKRSNDYILAIAELQVLDAGGQNMAKNATVESLDSIEAPTRWRRTNLVDGIWPLATDAAVTRQLAGAKKRETLLMRDINTPQRRKRSKELAASIKRIERELGKLPAGRMVYAATTKFSPQGNFKPTLGKPRQVRLLHRGNIQQPRSEVVPGTIPLSNESSWQFKLKANHNEGQRRAALAEWVTDKQNPLTWRSIVNRVWQYHFGRGIVATPNDFGRMGQQPTHPELLDWLATNFRDNGQSFRTLHRIIVTSATYRQASVHDESQSLVDGDNRFLWRMNRRRLSAEELRDSVLSVSGRLSLKMGGPGYYLFELEKTAHSPHYEYHLFDPENEESHRRSIYRFVVRSQPDPFMTTLDCADSSQSTPRRVETLTALQALSLLNNRFMLSMSAHFAKRLDKEATNLDERVRLAMQLLANREPTADEIRQLSDYARTHGLPNMCRVLFNLSEFVYVD
jgi:hypothetical protein